MSSRKVVINGVTYIRSRDAARAVNLAPDYISRLARQEAIAGKRPSGIWFVDPTSLHKFLFEQERQNNFVAHAWRKCAAKNSVLRGIPRRNLPDLCFMTSRRISRHVRFR
jgi:hypothetical protein